MAQIANIAIDQGTTFSTTISVTLADGTVRDLTGYTFRSQMRKSYYTNTYIAFTCTAPTPANGEIILSLTDTQTTAIKAGRYLYDLEIVSPASVVERIVEGIITVYPEVTK